MSSWFTKHLNWTVVLYWMMGIPISLMVATTVPMFIDGFLGRLGAWLSFNALWFIGLCCLLLWNLRHKGRSQLNIFWWFLPLGIGPLVFLCLENRRL